MDKRQKGERLYIRIKEERLYIRIDPDLKRQAIEKSRRTGITLTHIVTQALIAWIKPDST